MEKNASSPAVQFAGRELHNQKNVRREDQFVERELGKQKKARLRRQPRKGLPCFIGVCMLDLVFLTPEFYADHADCPEIEKKPDRPHVCAAFLIDGLLCCVPFRSNIRHKYAIWTDKEHHCGLDFSKTVVITDRSRYIDAVRTPYLRKNEHRAFLDITAYDMQTAMNRYLTQYRRAKQHPEIPRNRLFLQCSTLQYFEDLIF